MVKPKQFDPDVEEVVGHPSGQLKRIRYLGCYGGVSTRDQCLELQ